MKRIFLITSLAIALTLGGAFVAVAADTHTHGTVIAKVNIADVECTCGCTDSNGNPGKAIDCLCGTAVEELKKAGFSIEEIEDYINSEQI